MTSSAQTKAVNKYIKNHTRRFVLQCNNETDADIIAFLEASGNYNAVLKDLVRAKISQENA